MLHNKHDHDGALAHYQAALAISETLAGKDPLDAQLTGRIAKEHTNIGQLEYEFGKFAASLVHHRAALDIVERQLAHDASSIRLRAYHAIELRLLATAQRRLHHFDAAIAMLERSRTESERIAREEPTNATWQERLRLVYRDL